MENVVIASFDPTIFSRSPLSDLQAHCTLPWRTIVRDYPRLCTAHLALKVPIVLTTSSSIRKYKKAGVYPRIEAVYYDPFVRNYYIPPLSKLSPDKRTLFNTILNREPTNPELKRYFRRMLNLANRNYPGEPTHAHQPRAKPIDSDEEDEEETIPTPTTSLLDDHSPEDLPHPLIPHESHLAASHKLHGDDSMMTLKAELQHEQKQLKLLEELMDHVNKNPCDIKEFRKSGKCQCHRCEEEWKEKTVEKYYADLDQLTEALDTLKM